MQFVPNGHNPMSIECDEVMCLHAIPRYCDCACRTSTDSLLTSRMTEMCGFTWLRESCTMCVSSFEYQKRRLLAAQDVLLWSKFMIQRQPCPYASCLVCKLQCKFGCQLGAVCSLSLAMRLQIKTLVPALDQTLLTCHSPMPCLSENPFPCSSWS